MKKKPEILKQDSEIVGIALSTPRYDEVNLIHPIWTPETNGNLMFYYNNRAVGVPFISVEVAGILTHYRRRKRLSSKLFNNTSDPEFMCQ